MADTSITREERYLEYLAGDRKGNIPQPITRRERYLYELCLKGIGGEISPEEIKNAVNEYLEKNPVKPGATTEQAAQIEQNKKDVASLKEDISNKITKFYASSQGETHLADSDDGKIMDMMLYGKSEQKQYSGKNLIDCTLNTGTVYNAAYTKLDVGGRYSVIGTPSDQSGVNFYTGTLEPGTYTLSCTMESGSLPGNINIVITDVIATCMFNNGHISFTLQEASKINLWNDYGATYNTNLNATFAIQIEKGSTATSYEPYTGGIPSPNPDYPQEIKSVVNPTVKVCGKNLLNYDAWSQANCANGKAVYENNGVTITALRNDAFTDFDISKFPTTARIPVNVGETITISWDEPLNKNGRVFVFGNASTSNMIYVDNSSSKQLKYTIPSGVTFITFRFGVGNAGDTISYRNIQIEKCSTPTAYEPYHEQTAALPYTLNAIPVSSGGNVTIDGQQYIADYVDVERGKLVKTVDSSKLDNTQSIVGKTEWLLAEPQEIDLTTEEITAFKALATYYPTTNISISSEQLDGYTVFNYPMPFEDEWIKTKKDVDSLKARLNDIVGYDNAAAHNSIYRGKNLGTQFTAEMSANIKNGTFKDLYCGDYLVINGTTYRFMDLDYLYKTGDTSLETHHILVVPDAPMYTHVMNDTNTTEGGYVGSKMYISGLDQALAKIKADFGEAHIVTYRNLLVNAVSNGIPSSWAWYSRQIDLMNEEMVYGTRAWSQASQNGYDTGSNKSQLAAFKHNHSLISSCRSWYWLRAVCSSAGFCGVHSYGNVDLSSASNANGVRPCFLIS